MKHKSKYIIDYRVKLNLGTYLFIIFAIGTLMSARDKITILAFDETYLSQKICYDKKYEQFIGPHKCGQTLVARGIIIIL